MANILDEIVRHKAKEIAPIKKALEEDDNHPLNKILKEGYVVNNHYLHNALQSQGLSVIAEVKRASPSAGAISAIEDPVHLAKRYCKGGAAALSVLTDQKYFSGSLEDLKQVVKGMGDLPFCPVMRKEFIIDPLQIAEAVLAGATAVLLIVATLQEQTEFFIQEANRMGLDALVEVFNEEELKLAIDACSTIIGVNNRDLTTFKVDLKVSEKLITLMPKEAITVTESGIQTVEDADYMRDLGFDAILIGEMLVKSKETEILIHRITKGV